MSDLRVEIKPIEKFEVTINGTSLGEFEKESEWEGLVKIKNADGAIIVSDDRSGISKVFDHILGSEPTEGSFPVVKISAGLIPDR